MVVAPHLLESLGRIAAVPAPVFEALVDFVVAAPQGQRGVVAQAADVVAGLEDYVVEKVRVAGIGRAGKHEVLPYENAVAVGQLVEEVILIHAAAPNPHQVHVRLLHGPEQPGVVVGGDAGENDVLGYVVGAFGEERLAVDAEVEVAPQRVPFVDELDGAYPGLVMFAPQGSTVLHERYVHIVEMRFAPAVGLPQLGMLDFGREADAVLARLQGAATGRAGHLLARFGDGEQHFDPFGGLVVLVDDGQVGSQSGPVAVDVQGAGEGIVDAAAVVEHQSGRSPDAAAYQSDTPVPPVVVGSLAGVCAQVGGAAVVVGGVVDAGQTVYRLYGLEGRGEVYGEGILARNDFIPYLLLPGHEHVVGLHHRLAVENDAGKGVESLEDEAGTGVPGQVVGIDGEGGGVAPPFRFDPGHLFLVCPVERVVEQPVAQQVGMHGAGHHGRVREAIPFGGEAPPSVEFDYAGIVVCRL